jgi:uncharacterized membrane protein YdjX (TVP38/TMEM64 family)
MAEPQTSETSDSRRAKAVALGVAVALLIAAGFLLPVKEGAGRLLTWVEELGAWGPVIVILAYIAACLLFLPGSILTLGAGAVFGVVRGTIAVSIGSTLGAGAAFLTGRFLARDWIERKVSANRVFADIDRAIGLQGFKIVFLTRLSPLFPFNLLNYAFGLTKVRFWTYLLASWIGMFPATVMYVYLGAAAKEAVAGGGGSGAKRMLFWVGLAATIVVATIVTRIARRALNEATRA